MFAVGRIPLVNRNVFNYRLSSPIQRHFSSPNETNLQLQRWVNAYRRWGHLKADLDPLSIQKPVWSKSLDPTEYGLSLNDISETHGICNLPNTKATTVEQLQAHLEKAYCNKIGFEVTHLENAEEEKFITDAVESMDLDNYFTPANKRNILSLLVQSELYDLFLGKKFPSFKRYSLEGAESALPGIDAIFTRASQHGVEEIVIGMPHRGRFNLLASLLDYPSRALFAKIKGKSDIPKEMVGWDDVPSHIGQSVTKKFYKDRSVHISLIHNPSHLEAVNPVSLGKTRAKMDQSNDPRGDRTLCLQIHGDAAFSGQGIVMESLMMANLPDFQTGGAIHLIINNQLGFTTTSEKGRSSRYASDIGKMINSPVLHVNSECPESVVFACQLATDFRAKFHKDVIIDLIAYRKHGHNELDEPAYTQPIMYENIRNRKTVVEKYSKELMDKGFITQDHINKLLARFNQHLEQEFIASDSYQPNKNEHFQGKWKGMEQPTDMTVEVDTGVSIDVLKQIGVASVTLPQHFEVHPRLIKSHIQPRLKQMETGSNIDWATGEALAFGSVMLNGKEVRISGQDVDRGTFSHRHSAFFDQKNGRRYVPLQDLKHLPSFENGYKIGNFYSVNSFLSELGVMGFEYGYNIESPHCLNIWEAQFGDFFNGAQVIIDTFVSSSETKWLRANGLVLLLPHGYDGAGPEHSSCRVERFLQLCDGSAFSNSKTVNLIVANCTTPANYFHILRRQILTKYRRPLVIVSPKTLLRHPAAVSMLTHMAPGTHFQPVISDHIPPSKKTKTVVFVSGKIYYDLDSERLSKKRDDIALIRIEELSPFPFPRITKELLAYKNQASMTRIIWCQEEPQNQGAWWYIFPRFTSILQQLKIPLQMEYIGRPPLPLPAVGSGVVHKLQIDEINRAMFN